MSAFERITDFVPAYDGRPASQGGRHEWRTEVMKPCDGTSKTNYGIAGVRCWMVLRGPAGAVQFAFMTDWYPPHVQEEMQHKPSPYFQVQPMGVDVGYHSPTPRYEGQSSMGDCKHLGGRECYYDGSSLMADEWVKVFLKEGSAGIWRMLEAKYQELFGGLGAESEGA